MRNNCLADRLLKKSAAWGIVDLWSSTSSDFVAHQGNYSLITEKEYAGELLGLIGDVKGMSCLDVGCGGGMLSNELASLGASMFAVDVSYKAVKHASLSGRVIGVQANGEKLPYANGTFDFCISTDVIEHIVEYATVLDEIMRSLKPKGTALLAVPNAYSTKNLLLDFFFPLVKGSLKKGIGHKPPKPSRGHINLFSKRGFTKLLEEKGYSTVDVTVCRMPDDSRNKFLVNLLSSLIGLVLPSTLNDQCIFTVRKSSPGESSAR